MPRNCLRADVGTEFPNPAGVGGMPPCCSFEQRDADAVLHLAHRDARRGLRDAEALGNRRHVVLLGKCYECTNPSLVGKHAEYRSIAYAALVDEG
jgi:hypothetical protein